jgi:cytidylate kinase
MPAKPLIIYVSGAPGAGKTTLASKLAAELYIPFVASDLIHGGHRFTDIEHHDRHRSLHGAFVPLLQDMAKLGISFVVDHVLQKGLSNQDIIQKILPYADVIIIHVKATDPIGRHLRRELARTDRGRISTDQELRERAEYHRSNLENTAAPDDYGLPTLIVDTTEAYDPDFDKIIDFIQSERKK